MASGNRLTPEERQRAAMRRAGKLATVTTLLAVCVALYSLGSFGLSVGQIFSLLWPVALLVGGVMAGALGLGYATLKLLRPRSDTER